jgi:hypothetical protein
MVICSLSRLLSRPGCRCSLSKRVGRISLPVALVAPFTYDGDSVVSLEADRPGRVIHDSDVRGGCNVELVESIAETPEFAGHRVSVNPDA